jgi:hypothetical protein
MTREASLVSAKEPGTHENGRLFLELCACDSSRCRPVCVAGLLVGSKPSIAINVIGTRGYQKS